MLQRWHIWILINGSSDLTQYFLDVPSKFLSSPHLVSETQRQQREQQDDRDILRGGDLFLPLSGTCSPMTYM